MIVDGPYKYRRSSLVASETYSRIEHPCVQYNTPCFSMFFSMFGCLFRSVPFRSIRFDSIRFDKAIVVDLEFKFKAQSIYSRRGRKQG